MNSSGQIHRGYVSVMGGLVSLLIPEIIEQSVQPYCNQSMTIQLTLFTNSSEFVENLRESKIVEQQITNVLLNNTNKLMNALKASGIIREQITDILFKQVTDSEIIKHQVTDPLLEKVNQYIPYLYVIIVCVILMLLAVVYNAVISTLSFYYSHKCQQHMAHHVTE
jgi:hypothetical protein